MYNYQRPEQHENYSTRGIIRKKKKRELSMDIRKSVCVVGIKLVISFFVFIRERRKPLVTVSLSLFFAHKNRTFQKLIFFFSFKLLLSRSSGIGAAREHRRPHTASGLMGHMGCYTFLHRARNNIWTSERIRRIHAFSRGTHTCICRLVESVQIFSPLPLYPCFTCRRLVHPIALIPLSHSTHVFHGISQCLLVEINALSNELAKLYYTQTRVLFLPFFREIN